MTVRDARSDEIDALVAAVAPQPLLVRYEVDAPKLAQSLREAQENGQLLVADEEGRACGFAWFLPTGTFASGGYLRLIALQPGHEGRGLGAALLDEVERRVAPRALFLLVSHWNQGARRFYASRGYSEVGRLPAFVRADTDEIICFKKPQSAVD
jgi:ribosomal protein S18 acetylase RimI-like enzyme